MFYNNNLKLFLDSVEDSILTLIVEFSIKSYVSPEFFSFAQKFSLKRYFDRRVFIVEWGNILISRISKYSILDIKYFVKYRRSWQLGLLFGHLPNDITYFIGAHNINQTNENNHLQPQNNDENATTDRRHIY